MADKAASVDDQKTSAFRALEASKGFLGAQLDALHSDSGNEHEKVKHARSVLQQALSHVNAELHTYEP